MISKKDPPAIVGYAEAIALAMIFTGSKAFLGYPRFLVEVGMTAGWLIAFIGMLLSMLFWLAISALLNRFPRKSLIEINKLTLGRFGGLAANLALLAYLIFSTSNLLRIFSDAVIITALPEAPISAIALLFIGVMWLTAYLGLESISRNAFIALPFILTGVSLVLLLLYPFWNFKELFPLFGTGLPSILLQGVLDTSAFGEILILAILAPNFSFDGTKLRNIGLFSIGILGLYFISITIVFLMVIPVPTTLENLTPFYQLSRSIYISKYYQRLESVFVLFWTYTAFLRLSLGLFVAASVTRDTFSLPYYRPLLPSMVIIFLALALTPAEMTTAITYERYRLMLSWVITLFMPACIWAIAVLRRKGGKSG